jgi:hypothetical protein
MKRASRRSSAPDRKVVKRKLADTFEMEAPSSAGPMMQGGLGGPDDDITSLVRVLRREGPQRSKTPDRAQLRKAAHQLAELCKQGASRDRHAGHPCGKSQLASCSLPLSLRPAEESIEAVVNAGAIEAVVPLLSSGIRAQDADATAR